MSALAHNPTDRQEDLNEAALLQLIGSLPDLTQSERGLLERMVRDKNMQLINALKSATKSQVADTLIHLAKNLAGSSLSSSSSTSSSSVTPSPSSPPNKPSTPSTTPSTAPSSTPVPMDAEPNPETQIADALKRMAAVRESLWKSSAKAVLKILQNVAKNPEDIRNRRLRLDNMSIKKFVIEVDGALNFLDAVGFLKTQIGPHWYLDLEPSRVNQKLLATAERMLQEKLEHAEEKSKEPKLAPGKRPICVGGCGFFGDPETDNYCSKCYRTKVAKVAPGSPEVKMEPPKLCTQGCGFYGTTKFGGMCSACFTKKHGGKLKVWRAKFRRGLTKLRAMYRFKKGIKERPVQANKSRCWRCNRKTGLDGIECKCGYIFCGEHRYPMTHECPFDYQRRQREKLHRENERVFKHQLDDV